MILQHRIFLYTTFQSLIGYTDYQNIKQNMTSPKLQATGFSLYQPQKYPY